MLYGEAHTAAKNAGIKWAGPKPVELMHGLEDWHSDFFRLSRDRQIGMVAGPIPHSTIMRHIEGWPWADGEMFYACMEAMDAIYLKPRKELAATDLPEMDGNDVLKAVFGSRLDA